MASVDMAQEYSSGIRVNALAPGFFLTEQHRFLLTEEESGKLSARGQKIIDHLPLDRFGSPQDQIGPMLWLLSSASALASGVVVPVEGGPSAYKGV
jgi:NAD(P)-dependent dehydrogenase (short-subunit alcohol dehydrogenase family)